MNPVKTILMSCSGCSDSWEEARRKAANWDKVVVQEQQKQQQQQQQSSPRIPSSSLLRGGDGDLLDRVQRLYKKRREELRQKQPFRRGVGRGRPRHSMKMYWEVIQEVYGEEKLSEVRPCTRGRPPAALPSVESIEKSPNFTPGRPRRGRPPKDLVYPSSATPLDILAAAAAAADVFPATDADAADDPGEWMEGHTPLVISLSSSDEEEEERRPPPPPPPPPPLLPLPPPSPLLFFNDSIPLSPGTVMRKEVTNTIRLLEEDEESCLPNLTSPLNLSIPPITPDWTDIPSVTSFCNHEEKSIPSSPLDLSLPNTPQFENIYSV